MANSEGGFSAVKALTKSLGDKYTRVLDADSYSKMSRFDLVGAGVLFAPDDAGRMSVSAPPMEGSSALAKGVHKGDLVVSINGRSTEGFSSFDVIDLVMADESPVVTLTLQDPNGSGAPRVVVLDRRVSAVADPVTYRMLEGTRTGYVRLQEFNSRCAVRVRDAVADLEAQGADRYILDLRYRHTPVRRLAKRPDMRRFSFSFLALF
jgi:carboxyl-terminal processing protease